MDRLAEHLIEAVYASNLVRTQQTAAPLAEALGLSVEVLPGLREISAGDDELATDATRYIGTLMRWYAGEVHARIPGGETALEFMERFDEAVDHVVGRTRDTAVVVSHGAALRVWASVRVRGFSDALGAAHLDNTGVIVIDGTADDWNLVSLDGSTVWRSIDDDSQRTVPEGLVRNERGVTNRSLRAS